MKAISIRIPDDVADPIKESAASNGRSLNAEIVESLTNSYKPVYVIGYVKLDRWGDLDERQEYGDALALCEVCSQDVDASAAYVALMSNGKNVGPLCSGCATSE